jgi:hypothetical protein
MEMAAVAARAGMGWGPGAGLAGTEAKEKEGWEERVVKERAGLAGMARVAEARVAGEGWGARVARGWEGKVAGLQPLCRH